MSTRIKAVVVLAIVVVAGGGYFFWSQKSGGDDTAMTIQFRSNSWNTFTSVEISPAGADTFVSMPLTDGTMEPAEVLPYAIADGHNICTYDLRATKEDGSVGTYDNVNLCENTFYHFEETGFE